MLTATAYAKLGEGTFLANGESGVFAGVPVEAVPAYDMTPGQPWHPKGEANGYVITLGGRRILFSGVGECVPEIQALERIDVAFILNGNQWRVIRPEVAERSVAALDLRSIS